MNIKLAKRVSAGGVCSRRKAEDLIRAGAVQVDGKVITNVATRVSEDQRVQVANVEINNQTPRIWMHHKLRGVLVTHAKDEGGRTTLFAHLRRMGMPHVVSVGRLDYGSEGLLLLTNSGDLAAHLENPRNGYLRKYHVRVRGFVDGRRLAALQNGLRLDNEVFAPIFVRVLPAKTSGAEPTAATKALVAAAETSPLEELRSSGPVNVWLEFTVGEGRNREVRRVLEHLGYTVTRLRRVEFGPFRLPPAMEAGSVAEVPVPHSILKRVFPASKKSNSSEIASSALLPPS